jgi:hypothetical protein
MTELALEIFFFVVGDSAWFNQGLSALEIKSIYGISAENLEVRPLGSVVTSSLNDEEVPGSIPTLLWDLDCLFLCFIVSSRSVFCCLRRKPVHSGGQRRNSKCVRAPTYMVHRNSIA